MRHLWVWTHSAAAEELKSALRTASSDSDIKVVNRWRSLPGNLPDLCLLLGHTKADAASSRSSER